MRRGFEELEHPAEGKHRLEDMSPTGQCDAIGFLVLHLRYRHLSSPLLSLIGEPDRCGYLSKQATPGQVCNTATVKPLPPQLLLLLLLEDPMSRGHFLN
ncbi:hypothetical protein HPB50_029585 [Hyalomma asiaticum]|nr:hypothetical protein HPB50_029585 [Hyalomma asiaticum]